MDKLNKIALRKGLKLKLHAGFHGASRSVNVDVVEYARDIHGQEMITVRYQAESHLWGEKLEAFRNLIASIRETRERPGHPSFEVEIIGDESSAMRKAA